MGGESTLSANKHILTDKDVTYPAGGWANGLGLLCPKLILIGIN